MMAVADVFPAEVLLSVVTADGENIFNLAQNKKKISVMKRNKRKLKVDELEQIFGKAIFL